MTFPIVISFIACFFCLGLAFLTLFRNRRSFVHWTFAIGMIALALEAGLLDLSFRSSSALQMVYWQRLGIVAASFLPGIWLIFTLSYGREENYKEFFKKQKWIILGIFSLPIILSTFFSKSFFEGEPFLNKSNSWFIQLGWSGYVYFIVFLLGGVLILMNLEKTFRASTGTIRWQAKFMLLGLGSLFAVRIYTSTQTLLYSTLDPLLSTFNAGTLIFANILILIALSRARQFNVNIYISQTFLYNSFIVLIVGIYLIAVGILAKAIHYFSGSQELLFKTLFVFILLLGFTIFILSEEVRQRVREFISRHFKMPQYDYRREWREFTKRTTSLIDVNHLSSAIVKMVAETFGVSSVSIWFFDELKGNLALSGSTVFSKVAGKILKLPTENQKEIISEIRRQSTPIDFNQSEAKWIAEFKISNPEYFEEGRIVYCIPLAINENFLGLLTLNHRITGKTFSPEDFDLLKTLADQAAGNLLNLKLSEHLQEIKQMEALQTMSAFMIHDLKNLASTLSLTVANLPIHFDNPDFRNDALQIIKQSVVKVNNMCSHLSMLSKKIELRKVETDLNELVATSLSCLKGCIKISLIRELQPVPRLMIDPEQVQKVFTNLLLNANEAVGNSGEIRLATGQKDGWGIFSISDNGCGMSKEFITHSLFRPFKSTKKQGMGIGLFQSKTIVEAHQGRIEVESEEGRGTTFKVFLPIKGVESRG